MWIYAQDSGWLVSPQGARYGPGYSGNGEGLNNPAMQNVPDVGPLPCGIYTVGAPQNTAEHGPFFLPLTPEPSNVMFNRSGFGMHGDEILHPGQHLASEGCIIQALSIREIVSASPDKQLEVVATLATQDSLWPNS